MRSCQSCLSGPFLRFILVSCAYNQSQKLSTTTSPPMQETQAASHQLLEPASATLAFKILVHSGLSATEKHVSSARCSLKLDRVVGRERGVETRERYVGEDCLSVLLLMHMHVRGRERGCMEEGRKGCCCCMWHVRCMLQTGWALTSCYMCSLSKFGT